MNCRVRQSPATRSIGFMDHRTNQRIRWKKVVFDFLWVLDLDLNLIGFWIWTSVGLYFIIYKEGKGGTRVSRLDYVVGCVRSDGSVQ